MGVQPFHTDLHSSIRRRELLSITALKNTIMEENVFEQKQQLLISNTKYMMRNILADFQYERVACMILVVSNLHYPYQDYLLLQ